METNTTPKRKPWVNWLLFIATVIVVFLLGLLANSVIERRSESKLYFQMVTEIPEWEPRNEVWGENFPREFETYKSTLDTSFQSPHGGSAMIDYLEKYPELVVMWAGYAFSRDYNQGRGHYYAVQDIRQTLRTDVPQPGTCWTCKSTDVPRVMNEIGVENFYAAKWSDLGHEIVNNIGCQDCHDPKTMNLRITRPALAEAFQRMGKDVNEATHQEMRSLVCAQCHVEYYFKGDGKYLTFPWDKGFSADEMETYYDEVQHVDWVHKLSRTPMLKAQHPDYELYMTGIHADRGVACADCHMPYKRDGGMKFTDHKIQSPLANISGSCQVCHRESEAKLLANVLDRQHKVEELRRITEKNLARVHIEAKIAWDNGATEEEMKPVLQFIRHAQWRWDWVAAANAVGFHSPAEALRVLGTSIQKVNEARILLTEIFVKKGIKTPVEIPDISTKEKAQEYIGLNIAEMQQTKRELLTNVVPQWVAKAAEREAKLNK
ncbi:ammonia-forming cytochrome c nitrite reductase [Lentimicrobium sp.]|jgi:nitrite reductase (cytochrome c-552)|uniref:ammonia-forming cytochrome c nitrite reductase n=1 Tax=Lentimicrobium sp. TaxID=2034841 RepID=UPI002C38EE4B|nr:ammonia-forming cytochrome c nitrite reductase [Lentimicrobium sp.]HPF64464.1 ammonia-forming cytochrome c nitrite reductase [Lentimicrobium sp.]HPJ63342.1 ammonia-forming cytochrome c nitrite reductase [Lentimicrobium sp.]HPR26651.1 ammonia-forming cytochrome c nitrite reductase [Lentimicrobium sp.]HRW70091.1 ammonia-forming cytochrome c nitrite reductase [Lentimicrobium sp.]